MMMTQKSMILSTILLFALIFSAWLIHFSTDSVVKNTNHLDTPDAYIINASYMSMDVNGNPHNQIFAKKMTHYAKGDISEFSAPRFILFNQDREPWYVVADFGQSKNGTDKVYLWKNVVIHEPAGSNNRELTMSTTGLLIFPETQSAITNQPVTIVQPGAVVNSIGLTANLHKGEVHLLSHAKGVYEATANNQ